MARPPGRPNADHEARREALLALIAPVVLSASPDRPSLRELARVADVQPNTLRHYFGDRDGLVQEVLARAEREGVPYMAAVIDYPGADLRRALEDLLSGIMMGWTDDQLGGLHAGGLAEGMGSFFVGPAYVEHVLEPTLSAFEALLQRHEPLVAVAHGDVRAAVLALISPVIMALLHQQELGGRGCRPLDLPAFLERHLEAWWDGWIEEIGDETRTRPVVGGNRDG